MTSSRTGITQQQTGSFRKRRHHGIRVVSAFYKSITRHVRITDCHMQDLDPLCIIGNGNVNVFHDKYIVYDLSRKQTEQFLFFIYFPLSSVIMIDRAK